MRRVLQLSVLTIVAMGSFVLAYTAKQSSHASRGQPVPVALPATVPDSVRIARLGFVPGRQLVVFVFGSGRCRACRSDRAKTALVSLRRVLESKRDSAYDAVKVIGVAVHTDLREGLDYLRSIGLNNFDEISVGSGWQNEHIERLIWRDSTADSSMPQVIIVSRMMTASLDPVSLHYGPDVVVKRIAGLNAIADFANSGAPLEKDGPPSLSERRPLATGTALSGGNREQPRR